MDNFTRGMGAMAPPGFEWQEGKTAATIRFVNEAEAYLMAQPKVSPIRALEAYVKNLKNGTEVLNEWLTVKEFMDSDHIRSLG